MAYSKSWDETQPDGSEAANTIDSEIQDHKIAVRERMNDILSNAWETDASDPKLLDGSAFAAGGVTYAARASERVVLHLSANETITTATSTEIPWDTETVDEGGLADVGGANPTRITIVNTGFYLVVAGLGWDAGTTGVRTMNILYNGSTQIAGQYLSPASLLDQNISWLGALTAANYLELQVLHSEGSDLDVLAASRTYFSCVRLA